MVSMLWHEYFHRCLQRALMPFELPCSPPGSRDHPRAAAAPAGDGDSCSRRFAPSSVPSRRMLPLIVSTSLRQIIPVHCHTRTSSDVQKVRLEAMGEYVPQWYSSNFPPTLAGICRLRASDRKMSLAAAALFFPRIVARVHSISGRR